MPIQILMPALSPTMTEGTIASWVKNEGDEISSGDVIAEIETDKAVMEVEAIEDGVLGKILYPAGSESVPINTVIALLLEEGEDKSALENVDISTPTAVETSSKKENTSKSEDNNNLNKEDKTQNSTNNASTQKEERIFISPLAKRIASQENIDISKISGTGPKNRIIKNDVLSALENQSSQNTSQSTHNIFTNITGRNETLHSSEPVSGIRKIIAQRLVESKQTTPHFYLSIDCEIDELLATRKNINNNLENAKISVNDFVIKASAMALAKHPTVNSSWNEDKILAYNNIDVSIAVSTDNGLITPIIFNTDQKSLVYISSEMKELANRARTTGLKPHEFQGGGFSISNLGMYGIKNFQAIINPPQSAILAVGAGIEKPVISNGEIRTATVMNLTLSVDHRVIDGAVAALFLNDLKKFIECPNYMLAL